MPSQAVAYLRVSTDRQGRSGLGLEAQREAIARFAEAEGIELLGEFVEVETGKGADALDRRPVLAEALETARDDLSVLAQALRGERDTLAGRVDALQAENERLRAILADQQNLRGSRLVGVLAAASRSVAGRWLKRLVTRGPSQQGAPFAWSWSQENGPDREGLCDLSEASPFFSLVAERGRDVVTVVHPNWRGVRSSAENLFDGRLYIDAIGDAQAALLAQRLHDARVERVVFHGLPMTHERLVRALRRFSPETRLFVIWHGNFMQLDESTDWHGLRTIIDWAREGVIERLGFVKQGMAEVFARQGIPTGFIQNYVRHLPAGPSTPMDGGPHLGLWAVEPIWRKLGPTDGAELRQVLGQRT